MTKKNTNSKRVVRGVPGKRGTGQSTKGRKDGKNFDIIIRISSSRAASGKKWDYGERCEQEGEL